ncbi:MAG: polyprenol monophosphomannose synthase [Candidatus Nanoarchaeia archaeon]|nr:polyprenol monophosphomannose synthase [Candidatus Nanoarchaeia archaeon]
MKATVVIPTYNERENITEVIKKVLYHCRKKKIDVNILVVDDNSPDNTAEIVRNLGKEDKRISVIVRKEKGLSGAIVKGLDSAKTEIVVNMDADLSHPTEKVPELIRNCEEYDLVIGSRYIRGGEIKGWPLKRILISKTATLMAKILLGVKENDPMSGFFAIKQSKFREIKDKMKPKGYKTLLEIIVRGKFKTKEIPITFIDRQKGKSKLSGNVIKHYLIMLKELMFD